MKPPEGVQGGEVTCPGRQATLPFYLPWAPGPYLTILGLLLNWLRRRWREQPVWAGGKTLGLSLKQGSRSLSLLQPQPAVLLPGYHSTGLGQPAGRRQEGARPTPWGNSLVLLFSEQGKRSRRVAGWGRAHFPQSAIKGPGVWHST